MSLYFSFKATMKSSNIRYQKGSKLKKKKTVEIFSILTYGRNKIIKKFRRVSLLLVINVQNNECYYSDNHMKRLALFIF